LMLRPAGLALRAAPAPTKVGAYMDFANLA